MPWTCCRNLMCRATISKPELLQFKTPLPPIALPKDRSLWESVVPMMTFSELGLRQMILHPVACDMSLPRYERGTPSMATAETAERIVSGMSDQSKPYGTSIAYERGRGVVRI